MKTLGKKALNEGIALKWCKRFKNENWIVEDPQEEDQMSRP